MDKEYISRARRYRKKGFLSDRFQTLYLQEALSNPISFSDFCSSVENNRGNVVSFHRKDVIDKSVKENLEVYKIMQQKVKKEIRI